MVWAGWRFRRRRARSRLKVNRLLRRPQKGTWLPAAGSNGVFWQLLNAVVWVVYKLVDATNLQSHLAGSRRGYGEDS
jgi:hypothetical protein